jgi:hypothetical protein
MFTQQNIVSHSWLVHSANLSGRQQGSWNDTSVAGEGNRMQYALRCASILSVPKRLRQFLQDDPKALSAVLHSLLRGIEAWLCEGNRCPSGRFGAVRFVRREAFRADESNGPFLATSVA